MADEQELGWISVQSDFLNQCAATPYRPWAPHGSGKRITANTRFIVPVVPLTVRSIGIMLG
jgi:hypothetical protein